MLFDEKFLESVKDDPVGTAIKAIELAKESLSEGDWTQRDYDNVVEACLLIEEMDSRNMLGHIDFAAPELSGDIARDGHLVIS